jgi:hypothetical protein
MPVRFRPRAPAQRFLSSDTASQADAYRALSILSHALTDCGLTQNRTKTTL